jgi:hypothetical protein
MITIVTPLPTATAAQLAAHAPSLSVHESCYGTATREGHRESIQGIEIRIVSRNDPGSIYQVQCFFLKRGKYGAPPTVDDTVLFDTTDPHGTYRVMAKPITLSSSTSTGTGSKKPSKSSSPSKTPDPSSEHPREGFLVRILHNGIVLREHGSSHSIEHLAQEDTELFTKATESKKARHMEASSLLVH